MTPSRTLYFCCLAFIAGVSVRSFAGIETGILLVFLLAAFALTALLRRKMFFLPAALLLASFWLGLAFTGRALAKAESNEFIRRQLFGKEVRIQGFVSEDPAVASHVQKIVLRPLGLKDGAVLANLPAFPRYEYGDILNVRGRLQEPPVFEYFNYKEFLEKEGVYAILKNPHVEGKTKARLMLAQKGYAFIVKAKHKFQASISRFVPHPEGAVFGAILFGDQGSIPESWKDKFNKTGVRHIMAVSGQHVALLFPMLMAFFLSVGLWRKQALLACNVCIALFIMLTGFSPSAVRAGIMGSLFIASQMFGRMNVSLRALVFAAAGMLLLNPLLLARDAGFQLSFLAVLGIVWFFPFFQRMLQRLPEEFAIRGTIALTLASQVTTLPLVMWNFHYVSLSSIFTNVLLAPAMAPLLASGLIFLVLAGISLWTGIIGAIVPIALVKYFLFIVSLFATLPFSWLAVPYVSPALLALYGVAAGFFAWACRKKQFEMIY
ncbi:MAG: ComEC/Rec2 family competence protein [Candidatus Wildermuthbacteria bacterium]|nr:ComEC/Rec2 family competence protein [Candidatus Wildermuthbacteria bacterium]